MRRAARTAVLFVPLVLPAAAHAQRMPFDRTIDTVAPVTLDVSTLRGKIEILGGAPGRIVIAGEAAVRVGWDVPANAEEIARRVAAAPPIEHVGNNVRLRDPSDRDAQRAVIVSYRVEVPPDTRIQSSSNSGATSIRGVAGAVDVRTQSAAIDLSDLSGTVLISTGSGAVTADRLSNVDVKTGSSAITLRNVRGGLVVKTQSGRVAVQGTPTADWTATTGSSSVSFEFSAGQAFALDAESRSGSVSLTGATASGATTKRSANGAVNGGGPPVRVRSGSGAIKIQVGDR